MQFMTVSINLHQRAFDMEEFLMKLNAAVKLTFLHNYNR